MFGNSQNHVKFETAENGSLTFKWMLFLIKSLKIVAKQIIHGCTKNRQNVDVFYQYYKTFVCIDFLKRVQHSRFCGKKMSFSPKNVCVFFYIEST